MDAGEADTTAASPRPAQVDSERPLAVVEGEGPVPLLPQPAQGSLLWRIGGVIRTMRPHQWAKNSFVLAPVVFAKDMFFPPLIMSAGAAFLVFCLLAGAVYTMNDIVDVEGDRVHPVKRFRPIPSGRVPLGLAKALAVVLIIVSLGGGALLDLRFAGVAAAYFAINVAYSFKLKKIAYVDVSCIAAGFVLRVVAGGFATHIPVSGYLLACTALLALFLGFGKRRHELAQAASNAKAAKKQREALEAYTPRALTAALALTALTTVGAYIAYTLDPATRAFFKTDWLWLTTFSVVFGMGRFLQLVTSRPKAESPTQEMLRDVPFVLNLFVWIVIVIVIVYALRPSGMPLGGRRQEDVAVAQAKTAKKDGPPPGTYRTDAVTDVALTMPIFVAYHIGVVFLPVRNAADVVTSRLAALAQHDKLLYMALTAALGGLVVLALLVLGHREKLRWQTFFLVAVEGVLYAVTMRYLAGLATSALPLAMPGTQNDLLTSIVMSLGAGFYEEMAFRVVAFGLGAKFLLHLDDWPKWIVMPLWALACAAAFSGWHHLGAMGEPFELRAFVFRTVCGLVFTVIYTFRGFAPAVWTHALYDIWVMAL